MAKNQEKDLQTTLKDIEKKAGSLKRIYGNFQKKADDVESSYRSIVDQLSEVKNKLLGLEKENDQLRTTNLELIHKFVIAAEYYDNDTPNHIIRISAYAALLAEFCKLPKQKITNLFYAAPLHDVGKIGIPDHILYKPGSLTKEEFEVVKTHTTLGAEFLSNSKSEIIKMGAVIALSHHERWNGKGYPNGISKNKIPKEVQIVSLVDVFDVLVSERSHKNSYPLDMTFNLIDKEKGNHFDPELVDVFFKKKKQFLDLKKELEKGKDKSAARWGS